MRLPSCFFKQVSASFFGKKEAKKLLLMSPAVENVWGPISKSFLVPRRGAFFSKKNLLLA
jgi:hypothetical protein